MDNVICFRSWVSKTYPIKTLL